MLNFLVAFGNIQLSCGQGTWIQKADFTNPRLLAFSFSINGYGYIGRGVYANGVHDFWRYDPVNNSWTQMAMPSTEGFVWVVGFADSTNGYAGTGRTLGGDASNDFWQYLPDSNIWIQKTNLPGPLRAGAFGFFAGGFGYLGGGSNTDSTVYYNDFYKYDPLANSWTAVASCPLSLRSPGTFTVNGNGYVVCGKDGNLWFTSETWEYDPVLDTWNQRADFPGIARYEPGSFAMNGKGYVGAGYRDSTVGYNDFYEYDPLADTWTLISPYAGTGARGPAGFAIDGKGYLAGGGSSWGIGTSELWEFSFDPSSVKESGMRKEFPIYYNTVTHELTAGNLSSSENRIRLEIYNLTGEVVYEKVVNNGSATINVESFPAGVYFVNIVSKESRQVEKIFIE